MQNWSELIQQFDTWGVIHKLILNQPIPGTSSPEGVLRMLGWVHLYTASGVHIYAFLSALESVLRKTPKIRFLNHEIPIDWIKFGIRALVFLSLLLLWKMQGYRFGFLRPMLSFTFRQLAEAAGFRWRFLMPLLVVGALDGLIGNPYSGRLHFYLAVGGGMVMLDLASNRTPFLVKTELRKHLVLAVGSWIWIAVYELVLEHRIALWTPLWSLITLPLLCTLFYPALVFAFLGMVLSDLNIFQKIFVTVGAVFNKTLTLLISFMDMFNLSFFIVSELHILLAGFLAFLLTVKVRFLKSYRSVWIVFWFASLLLVRLYLDQIGLTGDDQKIGLQLDVGQGDAFVLHQGFVKNEMIDVGSGRFQRPEKMLINLAQNGVQEINGILLTHLDEDHYGMLPRISALVPIRCVETHPAHWLTDKGVRLAKQLSQISPHTLQKNNHCVQMFNPVWMSGGKHGKGNALMAASVVELGHDTIYISLGDADQKQEEYFLEKIPSDLKQYKHRILKVSHHGSKFSSSQKFLDVVRPTNVWISVGRNNRYLHPHPEALFKLLKIGVSVQRTDVVGTVRSKPSHPFLENMVL